MAELLAPRCPTGALGWFGVTGRLVSTARILALILLAGCTPREVGPVRDAELATANTDGNLVLVFDRLADLPRRGRAAAPTLEPSRAVVRVGARDRVRNTGGRECPLAVATARHWRAPGPRAGLHRRLSVHGGASPTRLGPEHARRGPCRVLNAVLSTLMRPIRAASCRFGSSGRGVADDLVVAEPEPSRGAAHYDPREA